MRACRNGGFVAVLLLAAACGSKQSPGKPGSPPVAPRGANSDLDKVRAADISILFVGNSHTTLHDLPNLVCKMIQFRHSDKNVYAHVVPVVFLEDAARHPACREEIASRPWKFVVLQAQKISMSGRVEYSRAEGIELAKLARARGAAVFFYSEWGRKDIAGEGERHEKIYESMAQAADAKVARVGRAWDRALAARPDLPLHDADGNHQSALGAFLTACVLYERLTRESPAALASFPYAHASEQERAFLAEVAAGPLVD
jgi:hypothetical protein